MLASLSNVAESVLFACGQIDASVWVGVCVCGSLTGPLQGIFCILGPAHLEAAITAWWLITLPDIRSVDRGGSEPVSRGQPEVLSLNNAPVIAGHRESFNGERLRAGSAAVFAGGMGKAEGS